MTIKDLVGELQAASEGQRSFDTAIGLLLGWKRKVEYEKKDDDVQPVRKVLWIVPSSEDPGKVPHFSTSIEAALLLARTVAPSQVGGVSWTEHGTGRAIIGDGPYYEAATPALALCVAALKLKMERGQDLG